MNHLVSLDQLLDTELLAKLFDRAAEFKLLSSRDYPQVLQGKTVATLFYEPSTRTRLSFEAAAQNLGARLISTENAGQFSSAAKGESLEDSICTVGCYADCIILRHPEKGASHAAAEVSKVPIINAGDGAGEHPTQAMLDLFTVLESKPNASDLSIGLVGDLLYGRTIHSLCQLLALYKPKTVYAVAPSGLELPAQYAKTLKESGVDLKQVDNWDEAITKIDVLYMTRIQRERFATESQYLKLKDSFVLTPDEVKKMKSDAMILHPLPRVNEIDPLVDADLRALYLEQARNGLFVRMALLEYAINRPS